MKSYAAQPKKEGRTIEAGRSPSSTLSIMQILQNRELISPGGQKEGLRLPLQRVVIPAGDVPGMPMDFDTEKEELAKLLIHNLCLQQGRRGSLIVLRDLLRQKVAAGIPVPESVFQNIDRILTLPAGENKESVQHGWFDKWKIISPLRNSGEIDPDVQRKLQIWIVGDPGRGIGWKAIGLYLQGRLPDEELNLIGTVALLKGGREHAGEDAKASSGRASLDGAIEELNEALDRLVPYRGVSYRQADVAGPNVYGGLINNGDFIQDKSFWSTSALKIDGSAGKWGVEGTEGRPRVYFIIDGFSGRYISQYAGVEEGQHEVLFKKGMIFQVRQIANHQNKTFFVHLRESNPRLLSADTLLKNPYDGQPVTP